MALYYLDSICLTWIRPGVPMSLLQILQSPLQHISAKLYGIIRNFSFAWNLTRFYYKLLCCLNCFSLNWWVTSLIYGIPNSRKFPPFFRLFRMKLPYLLTRAIMTSNLALLFLCHFNNCLWHNLNFTFQVQRGLEEMELCWLRCTD